MAVTHWEEHVKRVQDALLRQTDRIRAGSTHTTIKGSSIEAALRRLLAQYLPRKFTVGTGQVANSSGGISPQLDVIVYDNEAFPHLAVNEDGSVVVCAESVHAVIECKVQLDNSLKKHLSAFSKVQGKRAWHVFSKPENEAGYYVVVVNALRSPNLGILKRKDRFVGLYSLAGDKSWVSNRETDEFRKVPGNALSRLLADLLKEVMERGDMDMGALDYSYHAIGVYFGWTSDP